MVNWSDRWFHPERSEIDAEQIGTAYADILLDGLAVPPADAANARD